MSDTAKRNAAMAAVDLVEEGMTLGLGTGSTAAFFVRALGERVKNGLRVQGVPTSDATARLAAEVGVPLVAVEAGAAIHLTVDGADEFDPQLNLIKGGGAALWREKIVAYASERMVVIADGAKQVACLGAFPLPVEVNPFGLAWTCQAIDGALRATGILDAETVVRHDGQGKPLRTDSGLRILDIHCGQIPDPAALAATLDQIPGVAEHGLFVGLAGRVLVGTETGVQTVERPSS